MYLQSPSRKAGISTFYRLNAANRVRNSNSSNTVLEKRHMAGEQSERAQGTWQGSEHSGLRG